MNKSSIIIIVLFFMIRCTSEEHKTKPYINQNKLKEQFQKANQLVVQKEIDEMDYFEKTHKMQFIKTPLGIRYYRYDSIPKQEKIKENDEISMNYTVSLLTGEVCYTDEGTPKTFIVGGEHIESGIHRIMPYLHYGDKAYILINSHLAHGLLGDMNKIPPQSPILYKVYIHKK